MSAEHIQVLREALYLYKLGHKRVKALRGKASDHVCVDCCKVAHHWSYKHDEPLELAESYEPRCRSCHTLYDWDDNTRMKMAAAKIGTTNAKGSRHGFDRSDIEQVRSFYKEGITQKDIAEIFGISQRHVSDIVNGNRLWMQEFM